MAWPIENDGENRAWEDVDPLLYQCFLTSDDDEAEAIVERLLEDARSVIRRIVAAKLCCSSRDVRDSQEACELEADVFVRLLTRLRKCRANPGTDPIRNWCAWRIPKFVRDSSVGCNLVVR